MSARRRSALAATLIAVLSVMPAAAPLGAQMTIGVRGGIGGGTLSSGESRRHGGFVDDTRWGAVAGVDAGIPLFGGLGVRIGLGLAQKGGGTDVPSSVSARSFIESVAEMDYLQFSALLRASAAAEGGQLNFGFLAGPYVGSNLSCNIALTAHHGPEVRPPPPPGDPSIAAASRTGAAGRSRAADETLACGEGGSPEVNSTDFGLAVGGGFEVKLSDSLGLGLELIYTQSLSEIDDSGRKARQVIIQSGLVFAIG